MRKTLIFILLISLPTHAAELTRLVRLKLAAGDIASGAHAAEDYRMQTGADAEYWDAIGWLARGAQMLDKPELAQQYVDELRRAIPSESKELLVPYGAAIEVQGRLIAEREGRGAAIRYFEGELARAGATSLQSRISKNVNLLALEGQPAPEVDSRLAALRGKPVLLYFFAEWCGDCKSQAPSLARIWKKYKPSGLQMLAVTRLYEDDKPEEEKAKVARVWSEIYSGLSDVPVVIDTNAMVRYGASATPTFALIDRRGSVRVYTPTRLSEAELTRQIERVLSERQE